MSDEKKSQIVRFTRYETLPEPMAPQDEKQIDFLQAWGHPVAINDKGNFFGDSSASDTWPLIDNMLIKAMHASFDHYCHREQCTVEAPLCYRGSWEYHWFCFWQAWVQAYQDSIRPRCVETRYGMMSVVHHVEPCTCHEQCEDEDE